MYAVFAGGGSQFLVEEGQKILIDCIETPVGETVEFDQVLMVGGDTTPVVGTPTVPGAKVVAEVLGEAFGPKIHMVMYKRRKNFRKHRGHRQHYTEIAIKSIVT